MRLPIGSARLYEVDITPLRLVLDAKKKPEKDEDGNEKWRRVENLLIPPSRTTNRKIIARLIELYKDSDFGGSLPGYDGNKLLYAMEALKFEANGDTSKEFLVDLPKEVIEGREIPEKRFYVKLSRPADNEIDFDVLRLALAGAIRTVPQDAVSALETVFKGRLSATFKVVGQSFFNPAQKPFDLGGGVDGWTGFHQSLKPIQGVPAEGARAQEGALALCVDTAVTAFVKPQPVIDFVASTLRLSVEQLRNRGPLSPAELQKVMKALRGLTLEVTHMGAKKKRIKASKISPRPVGDIRFEWEGRGECSVPEYFREHYGWDLRFSHLPAFLSGQNDRVATPFEVCVIAKGNRVKKLSDPQTSEMIKQAAQLPGKRRTMTEQIVQVNNYNGDPLIRDWGLEVAPEMMPVQARVLPAPELEYRNRQRISNPGKWNLTQGGAKQMYQSVSIDKWALLNLASREPRSAVPVDRALHIANELVKHSNIFGLSMRALSNNGMVTGDPMNIKPCIEWMATKLQPTFVLVILPMGKIPLYAELKRNCEVLQKGGLVTQCCSADKVLKANQQYYANLIQKINTKTGGQNVTFKDALLKHPKLENTMFMGADVSHAPGHRADVPSVAAVVGSLNSPVPTRYQAEVSVQKPRQEVIENLYTNERDPEKESAVRTLLRAYYHHNRGRPPSRIIFYRDGVSDGQFRSVLQEEVAAIKEACNSIDSGYSPPLTFIIVQKRHHTRFYPETPSDGDKKGNIKPGTVVDNVVSHPSLFDFFLTSHEGIQGTSRPIHYYVVYDENNFLPDEIQALTNDLCYTYAACTRSISVAPPAYYADLAATRARLYMQDSWDQDTASVSSGEAGAEDQWRKYELPRVQENLKKRMVFF
ncbi:Argonaute family protein [Klebsormidium nitens]|uniref:Argonaute family protein n=1 Tax=Klebsormidium nitens TaxID=105231 RepID=A0A1Y1I866_KLENI|nr:Argonaute family protein [Klebsormidium nitens]|eukprot:GAQ86142.1 Argonaute family protein [Klebsormidium nitens]